MKTIICGSRDIKTIGHVELAIIQSGFLITEVVSGMANGVDRNGVKWAKANQVDWSEHPAHWDDLEALPCVIKSHPNGDKYNVLAGHIRNEKMARYAEACIGIMRKDSPSGGTLDMISRAQSHGLKTFIHWI